MPTIKLDDVIENDVLARSAVVNDVPLFEAGTILTAERIDILRTLKVPSVTIESREHHYYSLKDIFTNIDSRFSYVQDNPTMRNIRMWLKDTLSNKPVKNS